MISTEETRAHAQDIYDYIMMNPEKHEQSFWVKDEFGNDVEDLGAFQEVEMCGTTMCAAGTSVFLNQGKKGLERCYNDWSEVNCLFIEIAGDNLGLSPLEAQDLFVFTMDNEKARDAILAIANGDQTKFDSLMNS